MEVTPVQYYTMCLQRPRIIVRDPTQDLCPRSLVCYNMSKQISFVGLPLHCFDPISMSSTLTMTRQYILMERGIE